jgi:signal transduction histidine kinase
MPVSISVEGDRRLPDDVQITLYRVAQEAIHNAVKHAQATIVDVHLVCSEHDVALTIRDDGCGFDDNDAKSGMGLDIMRDRMRVAGALLKINSTPDQGTTISAVWVEQNRKGTGDAF